MRETLMRHTGHGRLLLPYVAPSPAWWTIHEHAGLRSRPFHDESVRPEGVASCRLLVCGHPRGKEFWFAIAELCSHRLVGGAENFAGDVGGGHERFHEVADVGEMLQRGVGVSVPLEDDRLALVGVEEHFVLQGAWVSGSHDLHGLLSQALPLVQLAGVELDPCDALDLVHRAISDWLSEERERSTRRWSGRQRDRGDDTRRLDALRR